MHGAGVAEKHDVELPCPPGGVVARKGVNELREQCHFLLVLAAGLVDYPVCGLLIHEKRLPPFCLADFLHALPHHAFRVIVLERGLEREGLDRGVFLEAVCGVSGLQISPEGRRAHPDDRQDLNR